VGPLVKLPIGNVSITSGIGKARYLTAMQPLRKIRLPLRCAVLPCILALTGCATYSRLPLERSAVLRENVEQLDNEGEELHVPLDVRAIALLALRNNPDLVAARAQRGVARAQWRSASIAPNPSFSGGYGFLLSGPGTIDALTAGLSQDVKSLVTLSARRASARSAAEEIDARILWQEWQTAAKAGLLAVDLIEGQKQLLALEEHAALIQDLVDRDHSALANGDSTLTSLIPDLSALTALRKQVEDLRRQQETRHRDLNVLIGLSPAASLPLTAAVNLPPLDSGAIAAALPTLVDRRPDLVALQLGYESQEEKVRGAILAQFPTLSIGFTGGRDTSDVKTLGPQITIDLPVFDRNQGNIAVERATRQQLHDEFTARVMTARAEVQSLLADLSLLRGQLDGKYPELAELEEISARARTAYGNGDLDTRSYLDAFAARNAKKGEVLSIEQILFEQQIAIAGLLGEGMPAITYRPGEISK
jgi:outer membrane protein TolC